MNGGDISFFSLVNTGAQYFISDVEGYNLKAKGLMCNGDSKYECFIRLTEGTYVLRLGGGRTCRLTQTNSCSLDHTPFLSSPCTTRFAVYHYTHVRAPMLVPCSNAVLSHNPFPSPHAHSTNITLTYRPLRARDASAIRHHFLGVSAEVSQRMSDERHAPATVYV